MTPAALPAPSRRASHWPRVVAGAALFLCTACVGPLAAQNETTPGLAQVGEKVEYGGMALTVNSVERTDRIGSEQRLEQVSQPLQAGEGKNFLVINATLENKGQYRLPYQPAQFTVHDGQGAAYSAGVTAGARPLGRGELEPGKDQSGVVNFVVPVEAKDFVLTYRVPNKDQSISVRLGV
jgi:hypothetical protein